MLSAAENELLTRTNAGTPMGELFRRFWLPALLPSELPAPDCDPIRFRILGEDLVAFRDSNGQVGFLAQNCPHRGASLFFGRNEECGLRCVYHGWKFDVSGACVDMPNEPAESNFKHKVQATAYPAAEFGGLIWIYMGPADKRPPLPDYQWCHQPEADKSTARKWLQDSNYAQGLEGNIDSAHVTFLHREFANPVFGIGVPYAAPEVTVAQETEFGFVYGARRPAPEGKYHWRVTTYVMPTFTEIGSPSRVGGGLFVLPSDDEHSWWFTVNPPRSAAAPAIEARQRALSARMQAYANDPTTGLIPGTWRHMRNKDNDYLIDREMQRKVNYTGLPGNRPQDSAVTESMGTIYDRSREHLGTTDAAIILMRRYLMRLANDLSHGIEPPMLSAVAGFRAIPLEVVTTEADFNALWSAHHGQFMEEVASGSERGPGLLG
ncbi:MAG TPA: Rieske 2Fe-2S domain-containing protein [Chloroflexota bacterium]|nr:Rieske 2Fe-2S domain-containing protein [Chloroflexota bacterium]